MILKFLLIFFGISIFIIYSYFEHLGQYNFEPFVYNIGILIKNIILKINVKTFDGFYDKIFKKENIYYKFISNNICLARFERELTFHPKRIFPFCTYKIIIKEQKYIIKLKMPLIYLIIFGFLLYTCFLNKEIEITDIIIVIFLSLLCLFSVFVSLVRMKEVAINFIKIIKEGNK
jgi:hypothetical protein